MVERQIELPKTPVEDDEMLYRCVQAGKNRRVLQPDGTFRLSSMAFTDPNYRPSVNRAVLCDYDPKRTQIAPTDGVVSLIAREVRAIDSIIQYDSKGKMPIQEYSVDVEHVPLSDNYAHAEIYLHPSIHSKGVFRRLMERLAMLADQRPWEIELQESLQS